MYGRDDFQLGEDAVQYVRQCADDAAQALRGQKITQEILRANGVLPGIKARLFPYLSELRRRIAPVMLRRNRSLVRDQLPDRTEVSLDIPMTAEQQELHGAALSAAGRLAAIAKRRPLTPSDQNRMMAALQQARMACDAAGLVDKETKGSPKLDELAKILEELCLQSNRKAVVFSQWALMTEMVESLVRSMGLGCVRLYGGIPTHKRGALMDKFQNDPATQVFISTDAGGTGLNLQAATVLVNLDMPWNPAILDQRIARIHRLGQKQNVQIFLLLAEDSYEQRVASLVKGKRDLFDNVISPDASEDVVGVSKKMLQTLIDDLGTEKTEATGESTPAVADTAADRDGLESIVREATPVDEALAEEDNSRLRQLIEQVQKVFNTRIERILVSAGGLVVIVNPLDDTDEQSAQDLSQPELPVATIDARSWRSLQHLGAASPLAETRTLFESTQLEAQPQTKPENPLLQTAQEKFRSAEVLIQQQCSAGVMDLLASALLLKVAGLNKQSQAPSAESAAVWLYSEIVPTQLLSQDQVGLVMRIIALSQGPEVPAALIEESLTDVRLLFASVA